VPQDRWSISLYLHRFPCRVGIRRSHGAAIKPFLWPFALLVSSLLPMNSKLRSCSFMACWMSNSVGCLSGRRPSSGPSRRHSADKFPGLGCAVGGPQLLEQNVISGWPIALVGAVREKKTDTPDQIASLRPQRHETLPECNYTIRPQLAVHKAQSLRFGFSRSVGGRWDVKRQVTSTANGLARKAPYFFSESAIICISNEVDYLQGINESLVICCKQNTGFTVQ
jgi:hypothetical protein